jgi:Flp pilus assembly protein TadD
MTSKSRLRKSRGKRPPDAPPRKTVLTAPAAHKPWQIAALCLVLVVVTVFSFQGVRSNGFLTYDDDDYVLENLQVHQGLNPQSIEWAFTTFHSSNWHPLTWISHMVDWNLYGKDPGGHHMTNVLIHAANAVVLFLLLLYMTGFLGRSAIVAFLFALHPAHVESVAWIAERKDILCAFFCFAALLGFAWYVRKPSWQRMMWVVCAFACALMSKPMAVTLPFALLLLDIWPLRRITFTLETRARWLSSLWKLCVEKWLLFLMAVISSVITIHAQRAGGTVAALQALPLWARIGNAAISYCRYLRIAFWPHPLIAFYYYDLNSVTVTAAVLSVLLLILITAVCWHLRRQKPYCLVGWLWFLGTLAPVIGIVQVGGQSMAERYTYLPFIGLFIAVVWLVGDAVAQFPKIRVVAQLLAVAVIAACAVLTDAQVKVWKDMETLFSHVLEVDPRGEIPNLNLGAAYMKQGRNVEAQEYIERALVFNTAAYGPQTRLFLGDVLMAQGKLDEAAKEYRQVLAGAPENYDALNDLGLLLGRRGLIEDALKEFRLALAIQPEKAAAHSNLAWALTQTHQYPEAVAEYTQALRFDPDNASTHNNLGVALLQLGDDQKAVEQFSQAVQLDPNYADARRNLALTQSRMKNGKIDQTGK